MGSDIRGQVIRNTTPFGMSIRKRKNNGEERLFQSFNMRRVDELGSDYGSGRREDRLRTRGLKIRVYQIGDFFCDLWNS